MQGLLRQPELCKPPAINGRHPPLLQAYQSLCTSFFTDLGSGSKPRHKYISLRLQMLGHVGVSTPRSRLGPVPLAGDVGAFFSEGLPVRSSDAWVPFILLRSGSVASSTFRTDRTKTRSNTNRLSEDQVQVVFTLTQSTQSYSGSWSNSSTDFRRQTVMGRWMHQFPDLVEGHI